MPEIRIDRRHALGLARARAAARHWVGQVEQELGLSCRYEEGPAGDTVRFSGIGGVEGTMQVSADAFAVHARMGALFAHFAEAIEAKVARQIDALLAASPPEAPPAQG